MEEYVENNNITICNVLEMMGFECEDKEQSLIDLFSEFEQTFCLSLFPNLITDVAKYNQVEIFYQRYLDNEISKQEFLHSEQKFLELLKNFWLYNDTYIFIENDYNEIIGSSYWKRNIGEFIKSKSLIAKIANSQLFWKIDSINDLLMLSKISTREISRAIFFFKQFEILIAIDGCCGILSKTKSSDLIFNKIITNSSLYYWQEQDRTQRDDSSVSDKPNN